MISKFHELLQHYRQKGQFPGAPDVIARMSEAPKFVFAQEVIRLLDDNREEYTDALATAAAADMLKLPHDPMLIEFQSGPNNNRSFWLIESHEGGAWSQCRMWLAMLDNNYAIVLDGLFAGRIQPDGSPNIGPYLGRMPRAADPSDWAGIKERARTNAFFPLFYAMALHVRGIVTRPAKPVSERLDRARVKRGLPTITKDYVTVHIGYVEDRQGHRRNVEGIGGKHVAVHLRRGHIRHQPCGPELQDRKDIWIKPVLINWRSGDPYPEPNYLVVP